MKKLKKKVLVTLAFAGGEGLYSKEYGFLGLSEIYWRCPGYRQTSIRSILSVCLENGMVAKVVRGRKSQYRLTSIGREALVNAFGYDYKPLTSEKSWIMVVLEEGVLPEKTVRKVSAGFGRMGLASWTRGVWVAPLDISESIKRYITDIGAAGGVVVFEVKKWVFGDEKTMVERLWSPLEYEVKVKNLISQAVPLLTTIRSLKSMTEPAKNQFLTVFDWWVEIMTGKPKLPRSLLPKEWSFDEAEKTMLKLCASVLELERESIK